MELYPVINGELNGRLDAIMHYVWVADYNGLLRRWVFRFTVSKQMNREFRKNKGTGRQVLDGMVGGMRVTVFIDKATKDFLRSIPGPCGEKGNVSMGIRTLCREARAMAEAFAAHLNDEKTR